MILEEKPEMVMGIPLDDNEEKSTLYLARVFGETINKLVGGISIQQIGTPDVSYIEKNPLKPFPIDNGIEGQIIFIDNFENVIVNITRSYFEEQRKGRNFKIIF
jgi:S-adenosylmethionine hydrolase